MLKDTPVCLCCRAHKGGDWRHFCGSPSAPEVIEHRMSQADHRYAIVVLLPSVFECRQPDGVKSSDKLNNHHHPMPGSIYPLFVINKSKGEICN